MNFNWRGKSLDGKTIVLKRLELGHFEFPSYFNPAWELAHADQIRLGAVVDVETSGLNFGQDKIIEIGIRQFKFNRSSGEILKLENAFSAFQDPGFALSEEVKGLTGITDEMVKGQAIDWTKVNEILGQSQLVVAHNASFDRPFIDQLSSVSKEKIWACSFKQIDWQKKGLNSQKLEILSIYHGFFNESHRALSDSDSLLYLLSLKDDTTQAPYFSELMNNARKPTIHMVASNSPFESKDLLRNKNYRWDAQGKYWSKHIAKEQLTTEVEWLEKEVYNGKFRGKYAEIQPVDQFKAD